MLLLARLRGEAEADRHRQAQVVEKALQWPRRDLTG
jgi:hypothetical protein